MTVVWLLSGLLVGLLLGIYLMRCSYRRCVPRWPSVRDGLKRHEIAGFLGGGVVKFAPGLLTRVVYTTEKTIVFHHPRPKHTVHLMFVPRKDIKNIGQLEDEDLPYIADMFSTIVTMVEHYQLEDYRLWTNGPGKQDVAYLHFHLGADHC